jgi:hypothetical protein
LRARRTFERTGKAQCELVVRPSADGKVSFHNNSGRTNLVAYIVGQLGGLIPIPGGIGGVDGGLIGTLVLYDGSGFTGAAVYGHSDRYADVVSRFHRPPPGTGLARLEETRQTIQMTDIAAEATYDEIRRLNPDFGRVRTGLAVSLELQVRGHALGARRQSEAGKGRKRQG